MSNYPISENTIVCTYYSTLLSTDWQELSCKINELIMSLSTNYLWHNERFKVILPLQFKQDCPQHLISSTCFGGDIEDEWFIVYLIFEITKHFDNLVVHLMDEDGEFLLIEAANVLPKWVKTDCVENRVFVHRGKLHIIPPELNDLEKKLSIENAMKLLIEYPGITQANEDIQSAIRNRIGNQPYDLRKNLHIAVAKVPIDLAAILELRPSLISHIVNTYCSHEIISSKDSKKIVFDDSDCVQIKLTFTKNLYAMLLHSKIMKTKASVSLNKEDKLSILGYKLACGYNIIKNEVSQCSIIQKDFSIFFKNLKNNGYFKDYMEGSKEYEKLLEEANKYYYTNSSSEEDITSIISEIMGSEEFIKKKETLKNRHDVLDDENEEWMKIQPDQLNEMLSERFGTQVNLKNRVTPETLTQELSSFLYKSSDLEGIEINEVDDFNDNAIQFDETEFAKSLEKMLNMIAPVEPQDESDVSSDEEVSDTGSVDEVSSNMENEISKSLVSDIFGLNEKAKKQVTMNNFVKSLKEEKGYVGPSSSILKNIGMHDNNLLDSDDDSE